ncbi:dTDP-4-dehydrorhamnose reductase [Gilliamella sp. G0441]|uniref:dTDP-4-dehydrorhamnose reductase n=1 Tax=Gilliamella sp. G0441 TaxID=3384760 RepID=UPI0025D7F1B1|nr:dTDP-4-dehydrorhamnose reductase [uncultured Gilliamella sp.]
MKVLLTGVKGQLGSCFQDIFPHDWSLITKDSQELDITDLSAVEACIAISKPDAIVNAAAYTAVDKAEDEDELAYKVNAIGPQNLAIVANKYSIKLIHISTDYVFDGTKKTPYFETDLTNPINVYGKTKREGELAVIQHDPSAIVIRTSWVFSEYGNNFVKTMLTLSLKHNKLSIIDDQLGCPTYAGDIANAILKILMNNIRGGIYHYCGDQIVSWFNFCLEIFSIAEKLNLTGIKKPIVKPILTCQYSTKAKRPLYSVLNMDKIRSLNIEGSDWKKALVHVISKIKLE